MENAIDDLLKHPGVTSRQLGRQALPATCLACPLVDTCGGGLITHRFDQTNGFLNPTVYCSDLFKLIDAIGSDLESRIGAAGALISK